MNRPITSEILGKHDLTALEKLLLIAIASHGQVAFPSQRRLAIMTSLSIRTVKVLVGKLREKNVITTNWERKSLTYSLAIDGAPYAPVVQDMHQSGGAGGAPVVQQMHRGGAGDALRVVQEMHPNSYMNSKTNSPSLRQTGGGGERVAFSISDTNLLRLVKRDPAWRTRIERAEAGDWYDGGQEVKPEAIIAQAMAVVRDKLHAEHDEVMDRVTAKGLPEPLAARLWASWLSDHLGGRPSPRSLLMASLADSSIRNHAAVWRAQLGYSDAHGEAQGTSAASGNG